MPTATANNASQSEVAILARVLGNGRGHLAAEVARYILACEFNDDDKARMHDLAVRNQADGLSPFEKEELFAYARTGTLLSILKSKARPSCWTTSDFFAFDEWSSKQKGASPMSFSRLCTTSRAAIFSDTKRTDLPIASV